MNQIVQKVTAFVTRENSGVKELLVFKHPTTGIQIPAGTVEKDEDIETAVKRETNEETGLQFVEIKSYLGCIENELREGRRIIAETTQVYIEPNLNAIPYEKKLTRGHTVDYHSTRGDFTHISYIQYNKHPNPTYIRYNITGWVPNEHLSGQKKRHFFHLATQEETANTWELKSDGGHIFSPFWTPLSPKPNIVPPQNEWLDYVYETILVND